MSKYVILDVDSKGTYWLDRGLWLSVIFSQSTDVLPMFLSSSIADNITVSRIYLGLKVSKISIYPENVEILLLCLRMSLKLIFLGIFLSKNFLQFREILLCSITISAIFVCYIISFICIWDFLYLFYMPVIFPHEFHFYVYYREKSHNLYIIWPSSIIFLFIIVKILFFS